MLWRWRKNSLSAVTVMSMTMKFNELKWSLIIHFSLGIFTQRINKWKISKTFPESLTSPFTVVLKMIFDQSQKQICRIVETVEMSTQPFSRVNFRRIHLNLNWEIPRSERNLNVYGFKFTGKELFSIKQRNVLQLFRNWNSKGTQSSGKK